jgi:hypothetical protein
MAGAFAAAAVLAAVALAAFGADERGTAMALKITARFSFLLFWLAYAGAGLAALLGPAFAPLRRHGRELGLAFAAAQFVHAGLVGWLCWIDAAPGMGVFLLFGPPLALVYILALFSIRRLQQALGRTGWRLLRSAGMTYIAYAFAVDFFNAPLRGGVVRMVEYLPFAALCVAGPLLHFYPLLPPFRATARPSPSLRAPGIRAETPPPPSRPAGASPAVRR